MTLNELHEAVKAQIEKVNGSPRADFPLRNEEGNEIHISFRCSKINPGVFETILQEDYAD